jgi:hypothetical protein
VVPQAPIQVPQEETDHVLAQVLQSVQATPVQTPLVPQPAGGELPVAGAATRNDVWHQEMLDSGVV